MRYDMLVYADGLNLPATRVDRGLTFDEMLVNVGICDKNSFDFILTGEFTGGI